MASITAGVNLNAKLSKKACTKVQPVQVFYANWPLIGITEWKVYIGYR